MTTRTILNALCAVAVSTAVIPATQALAGPAPTPADEQTQQANPQNSPVFLEMTLGEPSLGALNNDDYTTPDGQNWDIYHVQLQAGQAYRFSVVGQGYSASVKVLTAQGDEVNATTDAGENDVTILVEQTALYSIVVGCNDEGASGRYMLHSHQGNDELPPRVAQQGDVNIPQGTEPFSGELNEQSDASAQGRYFDYSIADLEAGKTYCFYGQSPDNNIFVDATSLDGYEIEYHAIEQQGAYIRFTPSQSGQYALAVVVKTPSQTASYTNHAWVEKTNSISTIASQLNHENTRRDDETLNDVRGPVHRIVGHWEVVSVQANGQTNEIPQGQLRFAFLEDGTCQIQEDGQPAQNYRFQISGNQITSTEIDGSDPETSTFVINGDALSITGEFEAGQELTFNFRRTDAQVQVDVDVDDQDDDDVQATDPALHGVWEVTQAQANGQANQFPAGALAFEFLPNGRFKMYQDGQVAGEGDYTANGQNLDLTVDGEAAPEHNTYQVRGNTLTINTVIPPNTPAVLTLKKRD